MDTPERNQKHNGAGTPSAKVEGSPVFNFINNLSPIKPVKSTGITQIFTSLNVLSPPSIFTSPHVSSSREFRFSKRHQSSEPSNSKVDLRNVNNVCCSEEEVSVQLYNNSDELQDNFDPVAFVGEASLETPRKQFKHVIELQGSPSVYNGGPDGNATPCDIGMDTALELEGTSEAIFPCSDYNLLLQEMCKTEQKVGLSAGWDSLLYNDAEVPRQLKAIISTSNIPGYPHDDLNYVGTEQVANPVGPYGLHETEGPNLQHRESIQRAFGEATHGNLAISDFDRQMANSLNEIAEDQLFSSLHFGRCLDFELVGGHGYVSSNTSNANSFSVSDEKATPFDNQLVPVKPRTDTSRCILPGIGLHLNAFGYRYMKHEAFHSEKQQNIYSSISPSNASPREQDSIDKPLATASSERGTQVAENGSRFAEQPSGSLTNEECNLTSLKKKKHKVEAAREHDGCKRCNCKKSKCLKLYCECFAAGVYCIEPCSCQDCFNKPIHEDTVLATRKQIESRNPIAFTPKVIRTADTTADIAVSICSIQDEPSKTPASARHKRGCNCKKSSCLKKYCECYQGGVGCSMNCRCEGCRNLFGRNNNLEMLEKTNMKKSLKRINVEPEADLEMLEKTNMKKSLKRTKILENEEQLSASAHATNPLQFGRPLVQLPFLSNDRIIGGSSSDASQPEFLQPQPRFENQLASAPEYEMPGVFQASAGSGVQTTSPNRKRVSPPNCDSGSTPIQRSGRKLILQSIPSFPSLS